MRCNLNSSI